MFPRTAFYNLEIALEALTQNKLRAALTSLGIIFGVASVIAMVGIGRGAQQEILAQMRLLGANNLLIVPLIEQQEGDLEVSEREVQRYTPGLTLLDASSLAELPQVEAVSPEVKIETLALRNARKRSVKLIGVEPPYFDIAQLRLADGYLLSSSNVLDARPVCVIGDGVRTRFFPGENPIGKQIKCGRHWLLVVGVLEPQFTFETMSEGAQTRMEAVGIRDYDMDVYIPITTMLLRYQNRASITTADIQRAANEDEEENEVKARENYHQLDRVVVQVRDNNFSRPLARVVRRRLTRRHNEVVDFEVTVPEDLIQGERQTQRTLNLALIAIASISLLVGGIGIMNIMLASVLERTREIGLRLSLGAQPRDIVLQFLGEAAAIGLGGGIIGVMLGVGFCVVLEEAAGIATDVSLFSILLSFVVALAVGLGFGIYPARRAARQDPVVSLRWN